MPWNRSQAGFTLIEIMTVITITLVVTGGGLAAYRQFDDRQKIVVEAKAFVVELREVQKRAQSGEKPPICETNNQQLSGWRVSRVDSNTYSVGAVCNNSLIQSTVVQQDLNQGVTFDSNWNNPITFNVLNGRVTNPVTITMRSGGRQYRVQVTSVGGIDDLGAN